MNKSLFLALTLALPLLLQAAGMGITVPITLTEKERIDYATSNLPTATYEYKPASGLGFVYDTNIGKNSDFSYRLNLEYTQAEIDTSSRLYSGTFTKHKYNVVNTFGFSLYNARYLRLWVGPRLNVQFEHVGSDTNIRRQNSYGVGAAIATGLNVHLGSKVSLGADIDYHGVLMFGGESYRTYDGTTTGDETLYTTFAGTNKGVTAHLYLLFRFGETYVEKNPHTEGGVIDPSL